MRVWGVAALISVMLAAPANAASESCSATGDLVLAARTPQVDLYDAALGKRVQTMDATKFPACAPITGRAPNMMLQVDLGGKNYWVPPYMVRYRFAGKLPAVCRNLALGSNSEKVGATRGLGEGCPNTGGK
ncbi:MAG: hypothetical protein JO261_02490 [Alphaproteobacteria bacterium]|nr:hypothetical protein [Alphaproteobacteria bacterium]MBV9692546.1 hypothetical protein [Alphaproteobacteria bacterium]